MTPDKFKELAECMEEAARHLIQAHRQESAEKACEVATILYALAEAKKVLMLKRPDGVWLQSTLYADMDLAKVDPTGIEHGIQYATALIIPAESERVLQDDFDITRTTDPVQRAIYWKQRCKSAEGKLNAIRAQLGPEKP